MFRLSSPGSFDKTIAYLKRLENGDMFKGLERYGRMGADALSGTTPKETGETARSWGYQIEGNKNKIIISWFNLHENDGVNIAIIIQYGHGTGTGGYVEGRDFINPTMRPIFDQIVDDVWREVTRG